MPGVAKHCRGYEECARAPRCPPRRRRRVRNTARALKDYPCELETQVRSSRTREWWVVADGARATPSTLAAMEASTDA